MADSFNRFDLFQNTKSGKCESIMEFSSNEPDNLPIVDFSPDLTHSSSDVVATAKFPSTNAHKTEISGFRTGAICFS